MASGGKVYEIDREKIEEHQKVVDVNFRELQGNVTKFAAENIRNAKFRKEYIDLIKIMRQEILLGARANVAANPQRAIQIWEEAALQSSNLRNMYLDQTRKNLSETAVAFSKMLKEEGLTFQRLIDKYSFKLFRTPYEHLNVPDKHTVMEEIVKASGRANPKINSFSKWLGRSGIVLILITIVISIYFICEAANPTLEAAKTAVSLGFGAAGGYVGGKLGAAIGACGGPVGVLIGIIVMGIGFGFLASFGGETLTNLLYRAFFPSTVQGPGPPPFDVIPVLYGQPHLRCVPVVGPPKVSDDTSRCGPPPLRETAVVGLPNLWPPQ